MQARQSHPDVWRQVDAQAAKIPHLYGQFDFTRMPERFTRDGSGEGMHGFDALLPDVMGDASLLELMAAYTLMGDAVSDAYAARIPEFGFRRLIEMLGAACDRGIAAVPDAPPELAAFLAAMEQTPDWIDMDLVREGARTERNHYAHLVPFAIRGAFLATFLNKYSALPMALTGNLSDSLAAKRVHETATFFTLTVMPGALERHGEAFKAAAMVRLMHSMVRFSVMRREGAWDPSVYGVPIPQVDQMPARDLHPGRAGADRDRALPLLPAGSAQGAAGGNPTPDRPADAGAAGDPARRLRRGDLRGAGARHHEHRTVA